MPVTCFVLGGNDDEGRGRDEFGNSVSTRASRKPGLLEAENILDARWASDERVGMLERTSVVLLHNDDGEDDEDDEYAKDDDKKWVRVSE